MNPIVSNMLALLAKNYAARDYAERLKTADEVFSYLLSHPELFEFEPTLWGAAVNKLLVFSYDRSGSILTRKYLSSLLKNRPPSFPNLRVLPRKSYRGMC